MFSSPVISQSPHFYFSSPAVPSCLAVSFLSSCLIILSYLLTFIRASIARLPPFVRSHLIPRPIQSTMGRSFGILQRLCYNVIVIPVIPALDNQLNIHAFPSAIPLVPLSPLVHLSLSRILPRAFSLILLVLLTIPIHLSSSCLLPRPYLSFVLPRSPSLSAFHHPSSSSLLPPSSLHPSQLTFSRTLSSLCLRRPLQPPFLYSFPFFIIASKPFHFCTLSLFLSVLTFSCVTCRSALFFFMSIVLYFPSLFRSWLFSPSFFPY